MSTTSILPLTLKFTLGAGEKREIRAETSDRYRLMFVPNLVWRTDANGQLPMFNNKNVECHLLDWLEGQTAKIVLENQGNEEEEVVLDLVVLHVSTASDDIPNYCEIIEPPESLEWVVKQRYSDFHQYFSAKGCLFDLIVDASNQILLTHPKTYLTLQGIEHYLRQSRRDGLPTNVIQYFGSDTGENLLAVFKFLFEKIDAVFYFNIIWMKAWDHTFANRIKQSLKEINQRTEQEVHVNYFETDGNTPDLYPMRADLMLFTYVAPWTAETESEFRETIARFIQKHGKPDSTILSVDPVVRYEGDDEEKSNPIYHIARSFPVSMASENYWQPVEFLKQREFNPFQQNDSGSYLTLWEIAVDVVPHYSRKLKPDPNLLLIGEDNVVKREIDAFDSEQPKYRRRDIVNAEKSLWTQLGYCLDVWFVDGELLSDNEELTMADLRDEILDQRYSSFTSKRLNRYTESWMRQVFGKLDVRDFLKEEQRRDFALVILNAEGLSKERRKQISDLTRIYDRLRVMEISQRWRIEDMSDEQEDYSDAEVDNDISLAFQHWVAKNHPHLPFNKATLTREVASRLNSRGDHEFKALEYQNNHVVHCYSKGYIKHLIDQMKAKTSGGTLRLPSGNQNILIPREYLDTILSDLFDNSKSDTATNDSDESR